MPGLAVGEATPFVANHVPLRGQKSLSEEHANGNAVLLP
jgi:hypothetical protein